VDQQYHKDMHKKDMHKIALEAARSNTRHLRFFAIWCVVCGGIAVLFALHDLWITSGIMVGNCMINVWCMKRARRDRDEWELKADRDLAQIVRDPLGRMR
jgi:hypothetical protein